LPIYFDFDGHIMRAGTVALLGNVISNDFELRLRRRG
jgi:hypothetical protein